MSNNKITDRSRGSSILFPSADVSCLALPECFDMDDWRGIYYVIDPLDVFDVRPVIDEAGEREDAEVKEGVNFFIFCKNGVNILCEDRQGISGSARTLAG